MKSEITSIRPAGHGHNRVTIQYTDGREYSAVTSHMYDTDDYRRDVFTTTDQRIKNRARRILIRMVKDVNGLR